MAKLTILEGVFWREKAPVVNDDVSMGINPIALSKAKIVYNFGLSECSRVKLWYHVKVHIRPTFERTIG